MPKQRLYLDESGDHTTKNFRPTEWDKRYLCLFGCSFDVEMCHNKFCPDFEAFKEHHFGGNPDDRVILHREDVRAKRGCFGVLKDTAKCQAFNEDLIKIASTAPFRAFAVVIDKLSSAGKTFGPISSQPYHVGLLAILERYCGWLKFGRMNGDVLAESRGGREDEQLKAAYVSIYSGGTNYNDSQFFRGTLTTKEIKIKGKAHNIAGLQLSDMLAYPAKRQILWENNRAPEPTGFTKELAEVLEKKYNRRFANSRVQGYGKILID